MNDYAMHLLAQQRLAELRQEAHQARLAAGARRTRRKVRQAKAVAGDAAPAERIADPPSSDGGWLIAPEEAAMRQN